MEALEYFRAKTKETQIFSTLVSFLFLEPVQPGLQVMCQRTCIINMLKRLNKV